MSEGGGSAGPDIGPNYQNSGPASYSNPPSQPPTPSSTVQDPPNYQSADISENSNDSKPNLTSLHSNSTSGLPPFSSFSASDVTEGLGGRLAGDGYLTSDGISSTRVMELSGWDYCYTDGLSGRYLERGDSMPVMIPQPQYRPWESKQDGSSDSIKSTLPSFQSQFGEELVTTLTTLTPAACSPAPSVPSPGLPSFHTLSAVNPRYPLVPAPVQAREIPSIQQQFLDERHIHLFQGPPGQNFTLQPQNGLNGQTLTSLNNGTTLTTLNNAQYHPQLINNAQILPSGQILAPQSHILTPSSQIITSNGHIITSSGGQGLTVVSQNSTPTVLTVVKTEPVNIVELKSGSNEPSNLTQLHHTNFQNPMITQGQQMDSKFGLESPPRGVDGRKKERRKIRASSLESSNESDGAMSVESSGQVAAVSSTAGFKSPMTPGQMNNEGDGMITDTGEKQTKKKRKRCGECIGCQRKDNCGDCAPCRNDKSHQICKMRRCEKLTEKKHLLAYNREDGGVSYRGRGRGRGRGSRGGYRGKGARPGTQSAQVTSVVSEMNSTPGLIVGGNRENVKVDGGRVSSGPVPGNPALAPAMAVPFYAGTEVWSASTPADPWASQGQFIHQIDDIRYQHYPGYQTTGYQQTGFITDQSSAFQPQYSSTSNGNPATSPAQGNVTPRSTGSYTQVHTPTPSPNPSTPHVNGHRNGINVHYVEENYVNGTSFTSDSSMVPPASTTPNSRSSSVHLEASDTNSKTSGYMSGNEIPGYPLNSPQCQSSCNSSGYPGQSVQSEFGDQSINVNSYQSANGDSRGTQKSPSCNQSSPGTYHTYQNYTQVNAEDHQNAMKSSISPGSSHPSQKSSGMFPQNSPKSYNSNPSPQNYQEVSPGQNRNAALFENRTMNNGNIYQSERFDHQSYPAPSPSSQSQYNQASPNNSNQDKSNVNARIKSMIMNKHQISQNQLQNVPNNNFSASNDNHMMSSNHEIMSPSHHNMQLVSPMLQNSQLMTSLQNSNQMLSPNRHGNQIVSVDQMNSPNSKDSKIYSDYGEKKQVHVNESSNHFLAFSHHLRGGSLLQPEGGGVRNWPGEPTSASNYSFCTKSSFRQHIAFDKRRHFKNMEKTQIEMASADDSFELVAADFRRNKFSRFSAVNGDPFSENSHASVTAKNSKSNAFNQLHDSIQNLEVNFPAKINQSEIIPANETESNVEGSLKKCLNQTFSHGNDNFCPFPVINNFNDCKIVVEGKNSHGNEPYEFQRNADYPQIRTCSSIIYGGDCGTSYACEESEKSIMKPDYSSLFTNRLPSIHQNDEDNKNFQSECLDAKGQLVSSPTYGKMCPKFGCDSRTEDSEIALTGDASGYPIYQKISYAPSFKNMEVIDKRFLSRMSDSKTKWEEYRKARGKTCEYDERKKGNYLYEGEGGPISLQAAPGAWCCRLGGTEPPTAEHMKDGGCQGYQTADEFCPDKEKSEDGNEGNENANYNLFRDARSAGNGIDGENSKNSKLDCHKEFQENVERLRNNLRADVPDCQCFPPDKCPPEPGSYYTHLGAAASLSDLRKDVETRTGQTGKALRIEKICYTGKEGKTTQGCPLAKWVIRRSGLDEKVLIVVKHRQGHTCSTAWIVVCLVAWEGVPTIEADKAYTLLSQKLNKFGLPTTRRCATNEPRTCACQGLDPDTCGASFSFGCSWSMYYNGCKYARSKTVRKFRLSVRSEEQEVEERMHVLATLLSPLYNTLAPAAFRNQTLFEREASECRLGFKPGRPFSGVTACIDFCAHSHRDLHNMNNGCTVVVTLTKHRSLSKPEDEQLHVLPLYIMEETDEFGCKESQEAKYKNGSIECLNKFPCEVRVRAVPLQPCRRHGKKRKDEEIDSKLKDVSCKNFSLLKANNCAASPLQSGDMQSVMDGLELQLQSSQVSSTVMDSPVSMYSGWNYQNTPENEVQVSNDQWTGAWMPSETQRKPNWLNSPSHGQLHWEYSGFGAENDVDPDSTTTSQSCSPIFKRSVSNAVTNSASLVEYISSPLGQSLSSWKQIQQVNDRRNLYKSHDHSEFGDRSVSSDGLKEYRKSKCDRMSTGHASEYSAAHSSIHKSSSFRTPRGRQPSTHFHCSDHGEGFFKSFPNDNNNFEFSHKPKSEIDGTRVDCTNHWLTKSAITENNYDSYKTQNSFSLNMPNLNSATAFCQGNNSVQSKINSDLFGNGCCPALNSDNKQICAETFGNSSGDGCNRNHQNLNFPNVSGRLDSPCWDIYGPNEFFSSPPEPPKPEPIGEVTDFIENEECFRDSQMGGVAIALGHGSVLFECAKHELHATTALKKPNRLRPTRISLVFYQHRNLNRAKHGWEEWEEKMRLRKLGISTSPEKAFPKDSPAKRPESKFFKLAAFDRPLSIGERILLRIPTFTTTTWTTLFPMRPCMVTGPYQESGSDW